MTLLGVTLALAAWCVAGTVVGLLVCRAICWAHGPDVVAPEPAETSVAPSPPLPAPRTTEEQLDVAAARTGSGELVRP